MKRLPLTAALLFLGLTACACSSSNHGAVSSGQSQPTHITQTPTPATSSDITVDKVGYAWGNASDLTSCCPIWRAAALVTNRSNQPAQNVLAQYTAYGADGKVAGTTSETLSAVPPGQQGLTADFLNVTEAITKVVLQMQVGGYGPGPATVDSTIKTQNIQLTQGRGGNANEYTVTGEVVSQQSQPQNNIKVEALAFDDSGTVVGGGAAQLQLLPGGGAAAGVTVTVFALTKPAKVSLYTLPA